MTNPAYGLNSAISGDLDSVRQSYFTLIANVNTMSIGGSFVLLLPLTRDMFFRYIKNNFKKLVGHRDSSDMLTETSSSTSQESSMITTPSRKWTSNTEASTAVENSTSAVLNSLPHVDSVALSKGKLA